MVTPGANCATQPASLPFPFPIRDPSVLRVRGMCGNKLNHTLRDVLSARLAAFFKKSLYRNTCLLLTHNGCSICKPNCPYDNLLLRKLIIRRFLNRLLCINFLGRNNSCTIHYKLVT